MSAATWLRARVARKTMETDAICRLELVADGTQPLPPFTAGAHIDLRLPGGLVRQYSLSNAPSEAGRYVLGVLREPASRGGSAAVHQALAEGDVIEISAPRNHFALADGAEQHLLLAGGIGITPLLSMAQHLAAGGQRFALHYCTRSRSHTAFLQALSAPALAPQVHHHFDDGDAAQKLDLAALLAQPKGGVHLYVCGPKGFMDWVLATARQAGWPEAQLHYEFFAGEAVDLSNAGSFQVKLASSGRVIEVKQDQTVVQALAACGIDVPVSCEQGVCGTCLTRVLEGTPEHKDMYLTEEEQALNDQFTPCCSRALTPLLVLDL